MADHTHAHSHPHTHGHDHSHDHDQAGGIYFIDQLCMVGLSGAFGMICLCLWFLQRRMLDLMLGPQFHTYVVISGFVLVALAVARGVILWRQSRDPNFKPDHDHAHGHSHSHSHDHGHTHADPAKQPHVHEHAIQDKAVTHGVSEPPAHVGLQSLPMMSAGDCGHQHKPGESCSHDHAHSHGHGHHHHDHDEGDHDHGWAPWRYAVILLPIILFLLGLPNKPPAIQAGQISAVVGLPPKEEAFVRAIALGGDLDTQLVSAAWVLHIPESSQGEPIDFKKLENAAGNPDLRAYWEKKVVEVRGQFAPMQGSDQVFMLVRLKISCCANDAVQLNVPMVCRESIRDVKINDWVKVTGRVEFRETNGAFRTVVLVSKASDVKGPKDGITPDTNPYIQ
jgi:hypothetical protein